MLISVAHWVYGNIRAVRQSILFSVARIFWSARSLRLTVIAIALIFLVLYGALMAQKAWQYGHDLDWCHHPDKNGQVHAYLAHPITVYELISKTSDLNDIPNTHEDFNSRPCFWYNHCITRLASSVGHKSPSEGTDNDTGSIVDLYHCDDRLGFPSCLPTHAIQEYLEDCGWSWGMNYTLRQGSFG